MEHSSPHLSREWSVKEGWREEGGWMKRGKEREGRRNEDQQMKGGEWEG